VLLTFQTLELNADMGYLIVGQLYIYGLGIVFIITVMNVFVFIIESGFSAATHAVYGEGDGLSVFIDHERLYEILQAAQANDPEGQSDAVAENLKIENIFSLTGRLDRNPRFKRRNRSHSSGSLSSKGSQPSHTGRLQTVQEVASPSSTVRVVGELTRGDAIHLNGVGPVSALDSSIASATASASASASAAATAVGSTAGRRAALLLEIQRLQRQLTEKINELATLPA